MKILTKTLASLTVLASTSAVADDWRFDVTPYVWLPDFTAESTGDPSVQPSSSNLSFVTDTEVEAGFLLYFTAMKNRHSFSLEFDWVNGDTTADSSFPEFPSVDVDWELFIYSLDYSYKIWEGSHEADGLSIGFGVRNFDVTLDTTLEGTIIPELEIDADTNWTDFYAELTGVHTLGETGKWYVAGLAKVGSGDSDEMLDFGASVGYRWSPTFRTSVGYRYLEVDIDDLEITQKGVLIAAGWTF